MKHSIITTWRFAATFSAAALLAAACTNSPKDNSTKPSTLSDSSAEVEAEVELDTLLGWVGDGTSMHNLEFIPIEGDTMELELSDDVVRGAELEVGRMVGVVVRPGEWPDMEVVATLDAADVRNPYEEN